VGQKILVVEDNELNLKLFCDLLRAHGYAAEPVRDGREAVDRARGFAPDLVVMDIQMPHISGLELIEQLKADAELKATPIMAVTAYAAKGDEERIRDAGAEGYVSKPISVVRFIESVKALLAAGPEGAKEKSEVATEVRVTRRFAAAAEQVFDAWLDPATVGQWLFATPEGEMVRVELAGREGGPFCIVERRDGEDVAHEGVYEAIERPGRLVFTLQVSKYSQRTSRIAVDVEPLSEGCRLVLTQQPAPASAEEAERYRGGWATILEGLAMRLGEEAVQEGEEP
jgi:two-component system cell cycle response regulator DivK